MSPQNKAKAPDYLSSMLCVRLLNANREIYTNHKMKIHEFSSRDWYYWNTLIKAVVLKNLRYSSAAIFKLPFFESLAQR